MPKRMETEDEGVLLADGFEEALIGIGHRFTLAVAVYDRQKCLDILMSRDGMTDEEAEEYLSFNVEGAFMGEHTPVFVEKMRPYRRQQCISCGGNMRSVRVDARLCSPACRSREYRKRKKKAQVHAKTG
tara:strand:+ start:377 stop:763 length:387 start_codon:yes stop_codon:yes gene_type:complete